MKLHLDTDFGGDPDDACALVMLLGWPDVELVGITTVLDGTGQRAGLAAHVLSLAGCQDVPVIAGAGASMTTLARPRSTRGDERYWPQPVVARPAPPGAALDLLDRSISRGATVVAIGPCTNLALLEVARPGRLDGVAVVAMGGWITPPAKGLPQWGPERDWNVQCDIRAMSVVADAALLTLVALPAAMPCQLRRRDLPRLRAAGPLGQLLAAQSERYGAERGYPVLSAAHRGLADDLVNFHWDPLTCAVALGWPGAVVVERVLKPTFDGSVLRFTEDQAGRPIRVLDRVDAEGFTASWLTAVEAASRSRPPPTIA